MLTYLCGLWLPLLATLGFPFMVRGSRKRFQVAHLDVLENGSIVLINIQGLAWAPEPSLALVKEGIIPLTIGLEIKKIKIIFDIIFILCKICSLCTLSNIHRNAENYIISFCVLVTFPLHLIICHFIRDVLAPLTKTKDSS